MYVDAMHRSTSHSMQLFRGYQAEGSGSDRLLSCDLSEVLTRE